MQTKVCIVIMVVAFTMTLLNFLNYDGANPYVQVGLLFVDSYLLIAAILFLKAFKRQDKTIAKKRTET